MVCRGATVCCVRSAHPVAFAPHSNRLTFFFFSCCFSKCRATFTGISSDLFAVKDSGMGTTEEVGRALFVASSVLRFLAFASEGLAGSVTSAVEADDDARESTSPNSFDPSPSSFSSTLPSEMSLSIISWKSVQDSFSSLHSLLQTILRNF